MPTVSASPGDVRPVAPMERVDEDGFGLAAPGAAFVYRLVGLLPVRVENLAQRPQYSCLLTRKSVSESLTRIGGS